MAEGSNQGVDPKGGSYQNEYKNEKAGKAASTSAAGGADKLKPATTGRGMQAGESVSDWKARIKSMDQQNETQQQALTK